jgi:hypothetical protein
MPLRLLIIDAKCSDMCSYALSVNGNVLKNGEGYVPSLMPNKGGDYVNLAIDIDSGKILNWKVPTEAELEKFIDEI